VNSGHTLFFRVSASCSKLLNDKSTHYSIQWKIPEQLCFSGQSRVTQKSWMIKYISIQWKFPGKMFLRASANCSKLLNIKKYIFSTVNSRHTLFFRVSASFSKLLIDKSTHYSIQWKIPGQLCFSGQSRATQKSWMIKYISIQWKFPGQMFLRASAICSKLLNGKKYTQYSEKFQGKLFSGQAQVVKNPECKKYIQYSEKFQGNSDFSGQVQVSQNSWTVKKFWIQCIFTWRRSA